MGHRYLADPSSLVTNNEVYVYCSNDDPNPLEGGYSIPSVVCISTKDMKNWTDHGIVFEAARDTTWATKSWAPAAVERDGQYYLYFGNGGGNIGVVTSTSALGPFTDEIGHDLINWSTPGLKPFEHGWLFDPGVFIDDDGQAYIYFGGNGDSNARVAKLNDDMMSLDGDIIKMEVPHFFEAAWPFKRNGKYYYSYSTTPKAGMRIDYMMSNSPVDGFVYAGVVADQPPINNNNNHAAQFKFKGKWYHVFHNRIVAKEAGIPTGFRRNIAIESLSFKPDDTIEEVSYTTDGVKQIGHLNPYERVEGETFYRENGVETTQCSAGGMALTQLDNGDWIEIYGVDFGSVGATKFMAQIASSKEGGAIEIHMDSLDGKLIAVCNVPKTGGDQNWKMLQCQVQKVTGVHNLFLKFVGEEEGLFNLNFWMFK